MNEIQSTPAQAIEVVQEIETTGEIGQLSYRQLIWRRFRKNRMGVIAGGTLAHLLHACHRCRLLRSLSLQ